MNLVDLSIKRPAFITCIMIVIVTVGLICFKKMDVNLFPNITLGTVFVSTTYQGAGPSEIETLVSKPLEEQISTVSGIKRISSKSMKDNSQIIVTFLDGVDVKYAEQQVRDKINQARPFLPEDVDEPIIRRVDPSDQPIMTISVDADISESELFDLADQYVRPRIEQADKVGMVEIIGGRKREIQIIIDQKILKSRQISFSQSKRQAEISGENVPIGKNNTNNKELIYRSNTEFNELSQIRDLVVNFYSNEVPTRISDIGKVEDGLEDENSRGFVNGKKALFIDVYRQSDSNAIAVVDSVKSQIQKIEKDLAFMKGKPKLTIVRDSSKYIKANVDDVYHAIILAVILTVIVVFFFLHNLRATLITSIALPISLISSFVLMYVAGFSLNVISLLAISLAVGLLVDDAIVVTENIYRKIESGIKPIKAASVGTLEILMAVTAITLVVISVFTPVGFMKGTVGQFMKEFGLTMSFSMIVSFFVAITIIPVLCAYLAKKEFDYQQNKLLSKFNDFQTWLEVKYEKILVYSINYPKTIILITLGVFALSIFSTKFVNKTFITENDNGELVVSLELSADASLEAANQAAKEIDQMIRKYPEVSLTTVSVGNRSKQSNKAGIYILLKSGKERNGTTLDFKQKLRAQLKDFSYATPIVKDYDPSGGTTRGGGQPFNLTLISANQEVLDRYANKLLVELAKNPNLKEIDSSNKNTRTEYRINVQNDKAKLYGVNPKMVGEEMRGYVEGYVVGKFRQNGLEYDIRMRLKPEQRMIKENFDNFYIPNVNNKLIKLSDIAYISEGKESATINRQDRGRYIQITANLAPNAGLGNVIDEVTKVLTVGDLKLPAEVRYSFSGDSENMQEMMESFKVALAVAVLFIYLILASLYESFITPFTILLALPFALCGVFMALAITGGSISIFAILGIFMLLGVAGKNSILLVDFTNQLIAQGKSRSEALIRAGKMRLRPILMTSFALIAGTIPVAIGLSEASKPRTGMGIAIIGGLISSTVLTLIVVPAIFSYVDRFRLWLKDKFAFLINKE